MKFTAFTSDPHYNHKNIIEFCQRPWWSIDMMNEGLIERYNSIIKDGDVVLWGGDCFFGNIKDAAAIMKRLNGSKVLVRGNHDRQSRVMAAIGFSLVMDECLIEIAGKPVRIKHYPYVDKRFPDRCPKIRPNEILIHGHTHSTEKVNGNQIHIGVDAWDYRPAMYEEIEELVCGI